ncbi:hypothetical protein RFI_32069 [Reticulomyxa filosa]|uniref:Uncharacterized protein n=1 Tax=Reticulomyxa filosa TaxID=46433 RepID=X6LW08_RETFI|nr:hypothetical protein RFI_32069 [Reticulomyxa filosa]|eukprot:ETO05327.1 hypothetical protein RFI_32069 [Reticulomyxa filosa]
MQGHNQLSISNSLQYTKPMLLKKKDSKTHTRTFFQLLQAKCLTTKKKARNGVSANEIESLQMDSFAGDASNFDSNWCSHFIVQIACVYIQQQRITTQLKKNNRQMYNQCKANKKMPSVQYSTIPRFNLKKNITNVEILRLKKGKLKQQLILKMYVFYLFENAKSTHILTDSQ